jgi:hypothetical protein
LEVEQEGAIVVLVVVFLSPVTILLLWLFSFSSSLSFLVEQEVEEEGRIDLLPIFSKAACVQDERG